MATVERFLNYLEFEKRFSKHTVVSYKKDLEQFSSFLKNQFELLEIEHATAPMVRSWQVHLKEAGAEARTMNRKLSGLRSFYKFCMRNGLVTKSPLYNIKAVKTPKRLPVFVEGSKMDKLLEGDFFPEGFNGLRDRVIFELFYFTGMRVSELVGLKQGSIDAGAQTIKVLGKRSKERIIPLAPEMVELLTRYMAQLDQQEFPQKDTVLFYTDKGAPATRQHVYRLVKGYLTMVTTLKKRSPHVLRHTFATHMLNNGAPINDIKEILGHASLAATQVYTHNTIEKLKEVYRKAGLRKE